MARFYCAGPLAVGQIQDLPENVAHHVHVLRLSVGERIALFDGDGQEFYASLVAIEHSSVRAEIKAAHPVDRELPHAITLAQTLPESSKMDWIVEKAVELGVSCIQPLQAQRCVVRLSGERGEKRIAHWQKIVIAASEQSGRNRLAKLGDIQQFSDWIAQSDLHRRIILTPRTGQSLFEWARHHPPQAVSLLIGPEGGFSEAEENEALAQGALALSMGQRILRTETAGLAAVAGLNAVWGDS